MDARMMQCVHSDDDLLLVPVSQSKGRAYSSATCYPASVATQAEAAIQAEEGTTPKLGSRAKDMLPTYAPASSAPARLPVPAKESSTLAFASAKPVQTSSVPNYRLPSHHAFDTGTFVSTAYGIGQVQTYREEDGMYIVLLVWSTAQVPVTAFLHSAQIQRADTEGGQAGLGSTAGSRAEVGRQRQHRQRQARVWCVWLTVRARKALLLWIPRSQSDSWYPTRRQCRARPHTST